MFGVGFDLVKMVAALECVAGHGRLPKTTRHRAGKMCLAVVVAFSARSRSRYIQYYAAVAGGSNGRSHLALCTGQQLDGRTCMSHRTARRCGLHRHIRQSTKMTLSDAAVAATALIAVSSAISVKKTIIIPGISMKFQ